MRSPSGDGNSVVAKDRILALRMAALYIAFLCTALLCTAAHCTAARGTAAVCRVALCAAPLAPTFAEPAPWDRLSQEKQRRGGDERDDGRHDSARLR